MVPLEGGGRIILPPFLEDRRAEVEARLTPLPDPRRLGYSHSPAIAPGRVSAQMTHTQSAITTIAHRG